ncbi:MAG: putative baseplate assembly protein [Cyanobacteria bacterium P01_G01_bin.4]
MEFDFLPTLPKSDLDDRQFQDLVEECLLRIPRYCPEWTNYNPSDPGITLVELFAWLTDQMLLRFNQVPRRNYVTFLEMLGIRLQPPAPSQTDMSFYLTASLPERYVIPAGTEVATERTETEEAIVFSTDLPLTIGVPRIQHFLRAELAAEQPDDLSDCFAGLWRQAPDGSWGGPEQYIFNERPRTGNCFYLVFSPNADIEGNAIAITVSGQVATSTGINPDDPPRQWEAWDGNGWNPVLRQAVDDATKGFSFSGVPGADVPNALSEADVLVHVPVQWPVTTFSGYRGHWLRCVCTQNTEGSTNYLASPQVMGWSVRSVGGTVASSQCRVVTDDVLGDSDGTPGQRFSLQERPVLPRRSGEHLLVTPPSTGLPEIWQEVSDFADSGPNDLHYVLDSLSGEVLFGPLVREPGQLREETQHRMRSQTSGNGVLESETETDGPFGRQLQERQYGAVPQRGARICMAAYRTGGGRVGNVQAGTIDTLKTAVPYVSQIANYQPARNGRDSESLEDAVLRVPRLFRTRNRAVTPEDFEALTLEGSLGRVARACCPPLRGGTATPGTIDVWVVPQANTEAIATEGLHPDRLNVQSNLQADLVAYLQERCLLGVRARIRQPTYVGVAVQAEVGIAPEHSTDMAKQEIRRQLLAALYRLLNPLIGGNHGKGWPFGGTVHASTVASVFQGIEGVRYLGDIQLFELRQQPDGPWIRTLAHERTISLAPLELACSWRDLQLGASHTITFVT